MAKKRANTQTESKPQDKIHHQQMMDDAAFEKLDSLKSLNAMLLKETAERRQQVDSLIQSNGSLQSELNQSVIDKASLQLQLNALTERAVMLEIEKRLFSVFVDVQVNQLAEVCGKERDGFYRERIMMEERIESLEGDMNTLLKEKIDIEKARSEKESEIRDLNSRLDGLMVAINEERVVLSRVCEERDDIGAQLDAPVQEENMLQLKVIEAQKRETENLGEVTALKANCHRLIEEKTEIERQIGSILMEKDLIQKDLVKSNGLVDELRKDIEELLEQKKAIEEEKNMQEKENNELQILEAELKDLVQSMRINEEALLEKVARLEKKCVESSENEVEMRMAMNRLVEEKNETEGRIWSLAEEKNLVMKDLGDALKMLEDKKLTIEQLIQERAEMEDAKTGLESEIVKMKEQLGDVVATISPLEKSSTDQIGKIEQLEAEVSHYKDALDQAVTERNEARVSLDEERTNRTDLRQKYTVMEKEMEDLREELLKMATENGKHLENKNELEGRCAALAKDVASLEKKLAETQTEIDGTKAKLGLSKANSNRVLNILRNTLSVCDENTIVDGVEEGIKDHVSELKAIKRVFKDKESRVEDMKRQLELLESSVAEAHKGKSFWTLVSSATTLLAAAVSVAYVSRPH